MLEQLKLLLPLLEEHAKDLEAEYRAVVAREREAIEATRIADSKLASADKLLETVRAYVNDTHQEVPL